MNVPCVQCRLRQNRYFRPQAADELQSVVALKSAHLSVPAKTDMIQVGEVGGTLYTLYEGWAFRYEQLRDGGRQILDILLPGDVIGLSAALLGTARHSVQTLTPASFCVLDAYPTAELLTRHAALTHSLLRWHLEEESRADRHIVMLGRRRPVERLGYLMLETFDRLRQRGLASGTMCAFPLQRRHIADWTGLSMIHLNRTLTRLRDEGLAAVEDKTLVLLDAHRLAEISDYKASKPSGDTPLV
jgi:CRP-like cAMP-binding protein